MKESFLEGLQKITDRCFAQELMSGHTTFRVCGPAEYYLCPRREQLS